MFTFTKLSDTGASNLIVARISIGLPEIIKLTTLSIQQKQALINIVANPQAGLLLSLLTAYKNGQFVINEIDAIENRLKGKYESHQIAAVPGSFESLSSIDTVLNFLKHSKSALRYAAIFLGIIKGKIVGENSEGYWEGAYKNGKYNEILKDLKKNHDDNSLLINVIERDEKWLTNISLLRNDDEHPKNLGGLIQNYTITHKDGMSYLERPRFIYKKDSSDLYEFIKCSMQYLLKFCEDLCVAALKDHLVNQIVLQEIPELERDAKCPKRFRLSL